MMRTECEVTCRSDEVRRTPYSIALAELILIFAVFFIQGAWPVPEVNEAHYLNKTIHYWNPDWLRGDFFIESPDTHKVFYFAFGWLSLWLGPVSLAWTGRVATWGLLAWAWRRLSVAVVPKAWYSVLTAALFVCLMERCHMAGEWVVGGVEAKGFSYVLVFLGIESLVRNRWNRGLLLFGAAAALHVVVGGWAAVAAGLAWMFLAARGSRTDTPPLRSLWPGIFGGFLLALPGIAPAVMLDGGVDRDIVSSAHQIYVFKRLAHHLTLTGIRPEFMVRLGLLWMVWLLLGWLSKRGRTADLGRLRAFVAGTVVITWTGVALHALIPFDRALAAGLLRYYWFRMTDVALPLGVALEGVAMAAGLRLPSPSGRGAGGEGEAIVAGGQWPVASNTRHSSLIILHPSNPQSPIPNPSIDSPHPSSLPAGEGTKGINPLPAGEGTSRTQRFCLALLILVAAFHVGDRAIDRLLTRQPRSHQIADYPAWREACRWIVDSGEIPPGAKFLTPRLGQTFKWYTGHSDVVTWKDVPQNAEAIIEWWNRIEDIHVTGRDKPPRWYEPLAARGAESLKQLGAKYQADYLITERTDPPLNLPLVYQNQTYVIYRL